MRLGEYNFFLDGASGGDDIKEYLDFQKSSAQKIRWGYVYSANNQPEQLMGFISGYYLPKIEQKNTQLLDVGQIGIKSR
jgi:penicillin amidase